MTKAEYKKQMEERMNNLINAIEDLEDLFEEEGFECNDYIQDDYPFEKSFDEYLIAISDWKNSIEEKLEKYKK